MIAQLCHEGLQFSIIFLHLGDAVVLHVVLLPVLVELLALNAADLGFLQDLNVIFKLIILIHGSFITIL